jgi:hypothetical protein
MRLLRFINFVNEQYQTITESVRIEDKDWSRMLDLVVKEDHGETVAKLIRDKRKAIARFVAGLKLANSPISYNQNWNEYSGQFSEIGNKALRLGATPEEIQEAYDSVEVPVQYIEKMTRLSGKKLNNRFVGAISKAILDLGLDITYQPYGGRALTRTGMDAMSRNGRKWTIGYKTIIDSGERSIVFNFDAITDEGDGPTYYVIADGSDRLFNNLSYMEPLGKNAFIAAIKRVLSEL